jgi:signal transduction histidine kinase
MTGAVDPSGLRPLPGSLTEAINHEFRNPLATLLGHLELVRDSLGELPPDVAAQVAASLAAMDRAGGKLTELVAAAADIAELHELEALGAFDLTVAS